MEVLEHGKFFNKDTKIDCICGCKFKYDTGDIRHDYSLAYTTNPQQFKIYVECPECGAKTYLGTTIQSK